MKTNPSNINLYKVNVKHTSWDYVSLTKATKILRGRFGIEGWGRNKIITFLKSKGVLYDAGDGTQASDEVLKSGHFKEQWKTIANGESKSSVIIDYDGLMFIKKLIEENSEYKTVRDW